MSLALTLVMVTGPLERVRGQTGTEGPGLSSGSGQGTGTGASSAIQRNTSGSVSGIGPGSATGEVGPESGGLTPITGNRTGTSTYPYPASRGNGAYPVNGREADMGIPIGPGVSTTFPDDSSLFPFTQMPSSFGGNPSELSFVHHAQLEEARKLESLADRSLSLQRVANAATFSNQLGLAHIALSEAADAALKLTAPLVHDQRLIAIVTSYNNLGEAHLREGKLDLSLPEPGDEPAADKPDDKTGGAGNATPPPAKSDRNILIQRAGAEWKRSAIMAGQIHDPTYRSEMLYRVVDTIAYGSQTIINDFAPAEDGSRNSYNAAADRLMKDGAAISLRIERPVWRDRALVSIASAAAASRQFACGLEVARMIPQPEVRTEALVRIAESQARRGDPSGATTSYREAAKAVASIPLEDPRAVLAGVLIDNLISVGRFDDARASIILYPDTSRQLIALGAVAESQGRRGAADSARAWISRDVPAAYRPQLLRRVNNGVLTAVEQNRSRDLTNRER